VNLDGAITSGSGDADSSAQLGARGPLGGRCDLKRLISAIVIVASAYVVVGKLALQLAFVHPSATAVWPPTGIAIAAVLLLGWRAWPGIFLGAFVVNLTTAGSAASSLGIALGNTLEALIAAYLANRFANGPRAFERPQHVFKFVLAALVGTAVSATIGVLSLTLSGYAAWSGFAPIWVTWWLGDAAGALTVAPLVILLWTRPELPWGPRPRRSLEAILLTAALLLTGWVVFGGDFWLSAERYPIAFVTLPAMTWAAVRFGPLGSVSATFVLSVIAVWGTLQGYGSFARGDENESLLLLQSFMGVAAVTSMALAAAVLDQWRAGETLRDSEQRFRATFEQAPVGVAQVARDGRWLRVNQRLCEMLGYTRAELLARSSQDVTFMADLPLQLDRMEQMLRGEIDSSEMEERYVRKSGDLFWCHVTVAVLRNADATPKYVISIIEDISARKEAQAVLARAAHELRSPVSHIKGFVSTLRYPVELDPVTRSDFLSEIESEADRLTTLIEDVLEHANSSGGVAQRRRVPTAPCALVGASLKRVRQELDGRPVQIDVPDDLPLVSVDSPSMERVLGNLLHNAHKYSPEGYPIQISARVQNRVVELHVDDHGPGIPVQEREQIFEPFFRRQSAAESSVPGKGLGLTICRSIVTAHEGEIRAEDRPGGGARFTVALPLKASQVEARRTAPLQAA
jgi:PAS domain S-box-containing protein